jgi:phosphatidylinositol kinase/protein kinase (PI-3  family)
MPVSLSYCEFGDSSRFALSEHSYCISENNKAPEFSAPAEASKMAVNQQHLKQAWDVSQIATKEDWVEWMHRLAVEFMKESPSHALRACMTLVEIHPPLAKELFNAAFISCWGDLYDQYQVRQGARLHHTFPDQSLRRILFVPSNSRPHRQLHPPSSFTDS